MRIPGHRRASPPGGSRAGTRPARPDQGVSSGAAGAASTPTARAGLAGAMSRAYRWLRERDPGWSSLRRAGRVVIVVPPLAAFTATIIGTAGADTFAVFAGFALLGMADFGGPKG